MPGLDPELPPRCLSPARAWPGVENRADVGVAGLEVGSHFDQMGVHAAGQLLLETVATAVDDLLFGEGDPVGVEFQGLVEGAVLQDLVFVEFELRRCHCGEDVARVEVAHVF